MFRSGLPPNPPLPPFQENAILSPSGEKDPKSLYPEKLVAGTKLGAGASPRLPRLATRSYQVSMTAAAIPAPVIIMPRRESVGALLRPRDGLSLMDIAELVSNWCCRLWRSAANACIV